jgi:MYXO-CTERM domain-containing protein
MRARSLPLLLASLLIAREAAAFCGFYVSENQSSLYNNATQVALMREGTRTVLSMQNTYEGPPENFALVVPVPVVLQKENVKTLPRDLFARLEQLDAPRLVEYWEQDPCAPPVPERRFATRFAPMHAAGSGAGGRGDLGVTVEAQFTVGEYEIVILSAADSGGLDTWLRREKYHIPDGAEPYLRPYVQAGSKFFVAKVDPTKVTFEHGSAALSPLRFFYDSDSFSLPVRLGLLNAKDSQDLIIHILAKNQRYEVANYANVSIPTNLDLAESAKGEFASVYNALFDDTLAEHKGAVVTEYSWDASTCDPCPGPALTFADIATLGGDVTTSAPAQSPTGGGGRRFFRYSGGYVLTRLHARYRKDTLGEDLVFRAAPPIVGGREIRTGGLEGALEQGAHPSSFNNFQARYAIRHPWTGAIACAHPVRGIWGGPPAGQTAEPTRAATQLAFSDRGTGKLSAFIGLHGTGATAPIASSVTPAPAASASPASAPRAGGCGSCETAGRPSGALGWFAALPALVLFWRKRRRKINPTRRT